MSKENTKSEEKLHECTDCGLHYRDERLAKACEKACKAGACDEDITGQSVERSDMSSRSAEDPQLSSRSAEGASGTQNDDFEAKWKRALADYQNLQREFTKEREKMRTRALQDVVEQLLPILDNFQAALQHSPSRSAEGASGTPDKNIESWVKGVEMIKKQMEDLLTDFGVKKIETVGKPFDPSCMEAVGEEESNVKGQKSNVVSRETLAGYRLGDTVIRAAKVILAAGK